MQNLKKIKIKYGTYFSREVLFFFMYVTLLLKYQSSQKTPYNKNFITGKQ